MISSVVHYRFVPQDNTICGSDATPAPMHFRKSTCPHRAIFCTHMKQRTKKPGIRLQLPCCRQTWIDTNFESTTVNKNKESWTRNVPISNCLAVLIFNLPCIFSFHALFGLKAPRFNLSCDFFGSFVWGLWQFRPLNLPSMVRSWKKWLVCKVFVLVFGLCSMVPLDAGGIADRSDMKNSLSIH